MQLVPQARLVWGSARRRMFTQNFAARFPEAQIQDLRYCCRIHTWIWTDRVYRKP